MAELQFLYGKENKLPSTASDEGAVYFCEDTSNAYIGDKEKKLKRFSSAVGKSILNAGEIFNDYSNNTASGLNSHAEGSGTKASSENQHVQGKYNIEDIDNTYAHIVGNGTSSTRSNAHTIDWDGNAWFKGKIKLGGDDYSKGSEVALLENHYTKAYTDSLLAGKLSLAGGTMIGEIAIGQGDGVGIQLGTDGRINATSDDGEKANTVLGIISKQFILGSTKFNTVIRGKSTYPTYTNTEGTYNLVLANNRVSGELRFDGGDKVNGSKIVLVTNEGQITNSGTGTLFGYTDTDTLAVGHSSAYLQIRGKGAAPTYNGKNITLDGHTHVIADVAQLQTTLDQKLLKTSFEWNKEIIKYGFLRKTQKKKKSFVIDLKQKIR